MQWKSSWGVNHCFDDIINLTQFLGKGKGIGKLLHYRNLNKKNGSSGCSELQTIKGCSKTIALLQFLILWDIYGMWSMWE